jgi:hypothetical protein
MFLQIMLVLVTHVVRFSGNTRVRNSPQNSLLFCVVEKE